MHNSKRSNAGRGSVGKTVVAGIKDRETNEAKANVVEHTDSETLQGFVPSNFEKGSTVDYDDARAYKGIEGLEHESVKRCIDELSKIWLMQLASNSSGR